ncbi:MAG: T9SS type A sorting domain-containing protein [Bacteroidota bacterium]
MKKIIFSTYLALAFSLCCQATIHQVSAANFQFSPKNLPNILVGDVVEWIWQNGAHTTTSLGIPAGATPWDEALTSTSTSFQYTVTIPGRYDYECKPHSPDMAGSFIVSEALPVVLTEFKAINNGAESILSWTTASEEQTDYFSVRKSIDGNDFKEIGRVPAAGNSNIPLTYSFTDQLVSATSKFIYYLVVIIDKDGKTQHSPIRMIVNSKARSLLITSLTPNPVRSPGHLMLTFNADGPGSMDATILNTEGKLVLQISFTAVKGVNNGHIHLGAISPGTYHLLFNLNDIRETRRLVIQ